MNTRRVLLAALIIETVTGALFTYQVDQVKQTAALIEASAVHSDLVTHHVKAPSVVRK